MKIGDLFLDLGIQGADKSQKNLVNISNGMEGIRLKTLAVNAAIIGMIYGIERSMQNSAEMGAALGKFSSLTGLSTDALQRWQYIARQANVSTEEVTSSVVGLQDVMGDMLLGKGQPEGIHEVARVVGLDRRRLDDTFYILGQLRKYLQSEKNVTLANKVAKSFGLTGEMIQFMRTSMLKLNQVPQNEMFSPAQVVKLKEINALWKNFHHHIQIAFGGLTAEYGKRFVKDLTSTTDALLEMVKAFARLSESAHLVEGIGMVFNGWEEIFILMKEVADIYNGKENKGPKTDMEVAKEEVEKAIFPWLHDPDARKAVSDFAYKLAVKEGTAAPVKPVTNTYNFTLHGIKTTEDGARKMGQEVNRAKMSGPKGGE